MELDKEVNSMLLSHKTTIEINEDYANIIGHMCYAAYKLWNICNYERKNYQDLDLPVEYPDWYYQKKAHKDDLWFKQLPAQTAQETCKLLDKAWKSFYTLEKTGSIENPNPPRFKQDKIAITYMQKGIKHDKDSNRIRLSLSKAFKKFMAETYDIHENFLYLENKLFKNMDIIKQIKIYPPEHGKCNLIVIYEVSDVEPLEDNGKYLSIDLGLHNLMTCYDSTDESTFIVGRKYLSLCHYYNKEIARVQSQWYSQQSKQGVKYPKTSKHIQKLYGDKSNSILDYLHKITKYVVDYCVEKDIHTVVIGDITNIRKEKDFKNVTNQKFHAWPYKKLYILLEYKLALHGIRFIKQKESYSSQVSPLSSSVDKKCACKSNRVKRGLYKDGSMAWNADCVGAFNILRLYLQKNKIKKELNPYRIQVPFITKVAV